MTSALTKGISKASFVFANPHCCLRTGLASPPYSDYQSHKKCSLCTVVHELSENLDLFFTNIIIFHQSNMYGILSLVDLKCWVGE